MYTTAANSGTSGLLNFLVMGPPIGSMKRSPTTFFTNCALALLFALLPVFAHPAYAAKPQETVLHSFKGIPDGATPSSSLTSDGAGNIYGTTQYGGLACPQSQYGCGTVFELSPNGNGGWNETVLYRFTGGTDGAIPVAYVIFGNGGDLYGTTSSGGAYGYGVVFQLSHAGAGWSETVLYSFANAGDGASSSNGLVIDPAGNLYGTTFFGNGATGSGTVFKLSPSGGNWTEQVIYDYDDAIYGGFAGLVMDGAGNIYGTTFDTVYELSPNGGKWNANVIHTFAGAPGDGYLAEGTLVLDKAGNLYGTTFHGGALNNGTVYELSPGESGQWVERVLLSFPKINHPTYGGNQGGYYPWGGVVLDAKGNIYGTTNEGGTWGQGVVFELVNGKGGYKEKVLWQFSSDGGGSQGNLLIDSKGNLYGAGGGVVYEVTP